METPPFKFFPTMESALENWKILEEYNLDLECALSQNSNTQLRYGSEFKSTELLELIFKKHPLWNKMKNQLTTGCSYPMTEISKEAERQDLVEAIEFGNHKGVEENQELFETIMNEEVKKGWVLVIPRKNILSLSNAIASPMNIASQFGIDENGTIKEKKRLTHNQSMEFSSKSSVNNRLIDDQLQDVMYGKCMSRVIHDIVAKRLKHPDRRILLQKIDYKSAYRRSSLSAKAALQTITQCLKRELGFIYL